MSLLAWMPFMQPMPGAIHWWWALIVPMVLSVSVTWKAIRLQRLDSYWTEVSWMTAKVLAGMTALALALIVLVQWVVPLLPFD
ncbi:MAG: hypothetical protein ACKPEA_06440 [Planctomycetota bacterium]